MYNFISSYVAICGLILIVIVCMCKYIAIHSIAMHSYIVVHACACVPVRLVGSNGTQGEVETYDKTDRLWKPLCDDGWNLRSASVICRQLNLGPPVSIYSHAATEVSYSYGARESTEYYIESLTCEGTESSIVDCEYRDYSTYGCHINETAGVVCSPSKALMMYNYAYVLVLYDISY